MSSIVLTEAELAQVPSGVIVTPGDCGNCGSRYGTCDVRGAGNRHPRCVQAGWVAPVRWTALEGRIELRADCPTCAADPYPCWKCKNSGTVLIARTTIQVVPVTPDWELYDDTERVTWDAGIGHAVLHRVDVDPVVVALDPLPVPGRDWVVVLSDVEIAS